MAFLSLTTLPTHCRTTASLAGALAIFGETVFARRRHAVARRRPAGPVRPGGDALGDCRAGTARGLPGPGRGKAGEGGWRCRRHHDAGRSQIVPGDHSYAPTRQLSRLMTLSRCRCRRPGGVVLLEMLNILEGFPMSDMKQGAAPSLHLMIEAMRRALPIARAISAIPPLSTRRLQR